MSHDAIIGPRESEAGLTASLNALFDVLIGEKAIEGHSPPPSAGFTIAGLRFSFPSNSSLTGLLVFAPHGGSG